MRRTIKSIILDAQRPDKPGDAERRILARKAGEQANTEMLAKFGVITPENAAEAIQWQENRIKELRGY